ncbi:MAG: hypothetical protein NTW21_35860 [Verrucomicrobia bacterium]|nr:hypothetical protein [Verrucomicrobiota bacterium]
MGNTLPASGDGSPDELQGHRVNVSVLYMAKHEVTKSWWDAVRTWRLANGYTDLLDDGPDDGPAAASAGT